MDIHAHVLFKHSSTGRLTVVNEPPFEAAPLIFIGITKSGRIVSYGSGLKDTSVQKIESILSAKSELEIKELVNCLQEDEVVREISIGPAYIFPEVAEEKGITARINATNRSALLPNFPYLFAELEYKEPVYAILEDGIAVSVCHSSRQTTQAAEAGLYTLEKYRRNGYGTMVALAWARALQDQGRLALYSTSWDNLISQAVASRLGLKTYGMDLHFR